MTPAERTTMERDGVAALRRGEIDAGRALLERLAADPASGSRGVLLLAQVCRRAGDAPAEHAALDRVLIAEPRNLYALLMKGELAGLAGDDRAASNYYQLALSSAENAGALPEDLIARLGEAEAAIAAAAERYASHLAARLAATGAGPERRGPRFQEALDLMAGRTRVFPQQPTSFYYPRLPLIDFYDVTDRDWLRPMLAALPDMRAELDAVLAGEEGIRPYVAPQPGRPNRGHSLLDDPRWSAFHLWEGGAPVADNARRCPRTMAALEHAPMPCIAGRSPMALFSVLRPGTHIPPHNGMLNTRLICHIPLIAPPGCRLRVGNETRVVEEGRPMLFDDSIEHEAWNDGDATRVVLLFEVWRPELEAEERRQLTTMFEAIGDY